MLNPFDSDVFKKCIFPLYFSLFGSIWAYTISVNDEWGIYYLLLTIIVAGSFLYSLWNIWRKVDKDLRGKMFLSIGFFIVLLHAITFAVNVYFQGIIALLVGIGLLVGFWKMITKRSLENKK